ncbi:hypothetical protein U9M48_002780 [Paspalum notatum var. saurae]|uniref:Peptidase A2 domain-containing protein n=1 Tax=Paspalum notatum var. saurae TaxID=547442 RepID=A0AAQ3PPU1_PASNO
MPLQQRPFQEKVKEEETAEVQTVNSIVPASKHIFPIMGGSSCEPETKNQKKGHQRRVNHIGIQGPYIKSRWSHVPITFDQNDLRLKDSLHNDSLVINCNIGGYVIHDVLVDNGSSADILMAKAFRQMGSGDLTLEHATNPLFGFGGRKVEALGKIALQVSFGEITNPRTEYVTFDVVDVNYPYNAILGRGTLNAFKAVLHPSYLGVISVHGSQEDARRVEGNWYLGDKKIHNIEEGKEESQQETIVKEKAESVEAPKQITLDENQPDQTVLVGMKLSEKEEEELTPFL